LRNSDPRSTILSLRPLCTALPIDRHWPAATDQDERPSESEHTSPKHKAPTRANCRSICLVGSIGLGGICGGGGAEAMVAALIAWKGNGTRHAGETAGLVGGRGVGWRFGFGTHRLKGDATFIAPCGGSRRACRRCTSRPPHS
jgi:hypothetical protein